MLIGDIIPVALFFPPDVILLFFSRCSKIQGGGRGNGMEWGILGQCQESPAELMKNLEWVFFWGGMRVFARS